MGHAVVVTAVQDFTESKQVNEALLQANKKTQPSLRCNPAQYSKPNLGPPRIPVYAEGEGAGSRIQ